MTSTTTTQYDIFSRTTGHNFGRWDATSADDALLQMEEQAGQPLDRDDLQALIVVHSAYED